MRKIIVLLLIVLSFPGYALAMEVTSPFGWRTHPITGVARYHSGIDIAADFGDSIPAVMPGTAYTGYDPGGYGNFVYITHADGSETLYGHCQQLLVYDGQPVAAGQIIALAGSTGASTGPHLHLEYRVDNVPQDPAPLLLAAGWDLNYTGDGGLHLDDMEMPWNFGDFYDVANQLRDLLEEFSAKCKEGLTFLGDDVFAMLGILLTIDLALASLFLVLSEGDEQWFWLFIRSFTKYAFFIWVISNWQTLINSVFIDGLFTVAAASGGGSSLAADNLSDPARIVQKGVYLVQPVFTFLTTFSGMHLMHNIHHVIIAMVLGFGILICFIVIGAQFFLTYLQFYVTCLMALPSVPFGVLKHTKFIGEQGIGAVIMAGLKLTTMIIIVSLIVFGVQDATPTTYDSTKYLYLLIISLGLAYFVSKVGDIVNLLNSRPKL